VSEPIEFKPSAQETFVSTASVCHQPIKQAEEILREFETTLLGLRNHWELMQELMEPSELDKSRTPHGETS
jgi:hypothetical protein